MLLSPLLTLPLFLTLQYPLDLLLFVFFVFQLVSFQISPYLPPLSTLPPRPSVFLLTRPDHCNLLGLIPNVFQITSLSHLLAGHSVLPPHYSHMPRHPLVISKDILHSLSPMSSKSLFNFFVLHEYQELHLSTGCLHTYFLVASLISISFTLPLVIPY